VTTPAPHLGRGVSRVHRIPSARVSPAPFPSSHPTFPPLLHSLAREASRCPAPTDPPPHPSPLSHGPPAMSSPSVASLRLPILPASPPLSRRASAGVTPSAAAPRALLLQPLAPKALAAYHQPALILHQRRRHGPPPVAAVTASKPVLKVPSFVSLLSRHRRRMSRH
jgi:hypothetical protein